MAVISNPTASAPPCARQVSPQAVAAEARTAQSATQGLGRSRRSIFIKFGVMNAAVLSGVLAAGYSLVAHGMDGDGDPLWKTALTGLIYGAAIGAVLGLYTILVVDRLRSLCMTSQLLLHVPVMTAIMLGMLSLGELIRPDMGMSGERSLLHYWSNGQALQDTIFGFLVAFLIMFHWSMMRLIGPERLFAFMLGRYNNPVHEERVFMFLDLVGSTRLAETLGDERYFQLLKRFYDDIADCVLDYRGETYQYIGDEIVVTWKPSARIPLIAPLLCVAAFKSKLRRLAPRYEAEFGAVPDFRVGFHYGPILAGEVGKYRRAITFAGDTVNTAARIANSCRDYDCDVILSGDLLRALVLPEGWTARPLGEARLRGRQRPIDLYTVITMEDEALLGCAGEPALLVAAE